MAADAGGFKHITVNTGEDDDIVIQAGVPTHAAVGEQRHAVASEPASVRDEAQGQAATSSSAEPSDAGPSVRSEAPAGSSTAERAESDDGYHETTLEDLQGIPMSTTQKAVIVVAALVIVGFIVYWLAFMK